MAKSKFITLIIILLTINGNTFAQSKHNLMIGTDVPIQYSFSYEYKPIKYIGLQIKTGVLQNPYDRSILWLMENLGTDDKVTSIIKSSFEYGLLEGLSLNIHSKKWYYGIYSQFIYLKASEVPNKIVEQYYGVNFDPLNSGIILPKTKIVLESELLQAGITIGRKFELLKWFEIRTEFTASKTIWNKNNISINNTQGTIFGALYSPSTLKDELETDLHESFMLYGYVPSLNVYLNFKF